MCCDILELTEKYYFTGYSMFVKYLEVHYEKISQKYCSNVVGYVNHVVLFAYF